METSLRDTSQPNLNPLFSREFRTADSNCLEFLVPVRYNVTKEGGRMIKKIVAILCFLFIMNHISQGAYAMDNNVIVLETNQGIIEIKLMPEVAPKACENFTKLAEKGYYDGLIFHRVIKNFMIQGGDPTGTGTGGESIWASPFEDEVTASVQFDKLGIIAMANAGPNTNGSQFFITTAKTPWLNMHHTIFGEVISGYDIVQKIENVSTDSSDRPITEQKIIKAYLK